MDAVARVSDENGSLCISFKPLYLFLIHNSVSIKVLSTRLLKSQSADSLINSDMDTAPTQATPTNHTWLDGIGEGPKDMDMASSAHSNRHSPQTHDAFLSLLTNKGSFAGTVAPYQGFHLFFLSRLDLLCLVEEYSVGSATDLTETSSVVDGDWTMVDENSSTLSLSQAELEHISMELANKGPHKSQVQLRWDAATKRFFSFHCTQHRMKTALCPSGISSTSSWKRAVWSGVLW